MTRGDAELAALIERDLIVQVKAAKGRTPAERERLRELKRARNRMARARRQQP